MAALYTNNASTTLASGITNSATSLTVASGQGSQFPLPTGIDYFLCTIQSVTNSNREIVKCTSRSGDTLTIVRAQEGTTAYAFNTNDVIELRVTAGEMTQVNQLGPGDASMLKNRIINGAMVINQRGYSGTPTADQTYTLDRWKAGLTVTSKYSISQNAGSVTPPIGFTNYLGVTSLSAYSVLTGDTFYIGQNIEGFNSADLSWGTANAKTITVSFWAYSSLTGTFGGSITGSWSYPFSYSVPVANTWTYVTVTIPGSTNGTWGSTNGTGIVINFGLGSGTTYSGTVNTWSSNTYLQPTGTTSVVGTSGATFYITGVQLEVGSSATGYEYRQYGQELALCQRYYQTTYNGVVAGTATITNAISRTLDATQNYASLQFYYPVTMRATPTATTYSTGTGASGNMRNTNGNSDVSAFFVNTGTQTTQIQANGVSVAQSNGLAAQITLSAEL